jgi:hypothetical protein
MSWTESVDPHDDLFHQTDADPYWNESTFISFHLPERNLLGLVYYYFRPNQGTCFGGPILWDHTGDRLSSCLYNAWDWHMPIPEGAEMFDVRLPNGLVVETVELLNGYRHRYQSPDCEFDLTYTATMPPHYMRKHAEGVNPGMSDFVKVSQTPTGHYEQVGLMNGTLTVRGETIAVADSPTLRDRTWGPRPLRSGVNQLRGGYSYAQAPDGTAFHVFSVSPHPAAEDPLENTIEQVTSGFYLKDGTVGHVGSGTRRILGRGDDGRPMVEVIDAVDEHGRELHAEGTMRAWLQWPGLYGPMVMWWCLETFTFDGHVDVAGEQQEFLT